MTEFTNMAYNLDLARNSFEVGQLMIKRSNCKHYQTVKRDSNGCLVIVDKGYLMLITDVLLNRGV